MVQQTEVVVPVGCSTGLVFKSQCRCRWGELSRILSLCAGLTFYMDGGKTWGAFNNPLIHWGIQVVKRLSQMELGRTTKYVLSSESAVSMVRNDFLLLSVGRGGRGRRIQNDVFFIYIYRCAHARARRNTNILYYKNVFLHFGSEHKPHNSCFMLVVIDHIWVVILLLLLLQYNVTQPHFCSGSYVAFSSKPSCRHSF